MSGNWNHVVAGLAAGSVLPLAAIGLDLPYPVAFVIAAAVYAGAALLFAPRRAAERIVVSPGTGRAQAELVAELIDEGDAAVARIRSAAAELRTKEAGRIAGHLAETARGILDRLALEPARLPAVRRFLTYYLPRAAEIIEGFGVAERQRIPDHRRQAELLATIGRLDEAFGFYADNFAQGQLEALDVELRLLRRSLDEDLGSLPDPAPSSARRA